MGRNSKDLKKCVVSKIIFCLVFLLLSQSTLCASRSKLDNVREQLWLSGLQVVNASYTWQDAVAFINQDPSAVKQWASDTTPITFCSLVHKASWGRIWTLGFFYSLHALFVRDAVIPIFKENDYVLIPFWGEVHEMGPFKALLKNARFPQNFFFLGNSDQGTEVLRAQGLQAFTVSHNAFIDSNLFRPIDTKRLYDAVYLGDCRLQKRLNLAASIFQNLLVVTHADEEQRKVVAQAKNIVLNPPCELFSYYINQAHCGLILSQGEGGCYASTEYLYCGVPVVSTQSTGGRDAYYDDVTAIIVDDTPEDVRKGVELMCKRIVDPWEVRRRALAVTDKMLNTLAYEILLPIFARHGDSHAVDPRGFINAKMSQTAHLGSKGRTVFQPENPTHDRIEKIKKEQRTHSKRSKKHRKNH
jgi:hypothetical protein